jgi:hypothetical protein
MQFKQVVPSGDLISWLAGDMFLLKNKHQTIRKLAYNNEFSPI